MTNIETRQFAWAAKHALIEMTMFGSFGVSDKVGTSNWIESLPETQVLEIADILLSMENDSEKKQFLEESYQADICSNKTSVLVNESAWQTARNQILMEADDTAKNGVDVYKVLKQGSAMTAAIYLGHVAATKGPNEMKRQIAGLKTITSEGYEEVRKAIVYLANTNKYSKVFADVLPSLEKSTLARRGLHTTMSNIVNSDKLTPDQYDAVLKGPTDELKAAKNADWQNSKVGIKRFLTVSAKGAAVVIGLLGVATLIYMTYQRFAGAAAKACRGATNSKDKTICILRFKIRACDEAIKKGQEALVGCAKHPNPEKCTHSIQTTIWNMNRRKKEYEMKLAKLVSGHTPTQDTGGSKPDIFRQRN